MTFAGADMPDIMNHIALHADSAHERKDEPPTMAIDASYLPGHIVIKLSDPKRLIVVEIATLVEALNSLKEE